jgi:hypothetical protein
VTPSGVVTTLAGLAHHGFTELADGTGAAARFFRPEGIAELGKGSDDGVGRSFQLAVDATGNVFVNDGADNAIRMITPARVVTVVAGVPRRKVTQPGPLPASLSFYGGGAMAVTPSGNLVITAENAVLDVLLH